MKEVSAKGKLDDAIMIASSAHKGQVDRAGKPYILHPLRLMMKMQCEESMIAAVLHDVVEDSPDWDLDRLRAAGFSENVVTAVGCLTKIEGEDYGSYVQRAAQHPIARMVKIADLEDNMNIRRIDSISEEDSRRIAKYHKYWRMLTS